MLLPFAKLIAALGLIVYGVTKLDLSVRQLPMDTLRDYLFKVFKGPVRSSVFGAGSSAVLANTLPLHLVVGSLIGNRAVNVYYAYIVIVWSIPGTLILYYLTAIPVQTICTLLLGILCFVLASDRPKEYTPILEAFFGLMFIIFGSILLSKSIADIRLFSWFTSLLSEAKVSYFFVFLAGLFIWLASKSIWVSLLIASSTMEIENFKLTQITIFLSGTCTAITLFGIYNFRNTKGGYKQLAALNICYFGTATSLLFLWSVLTIWLNEPKFITWVQYLGSSPRIISGNMLMSSFIGASLLLSILRPIIARYIDKTWPIEDTEDLSQTTFIEKQASSVPEIAMEMVQNEQLRYFQHFSLYVEIVRNKDENQRNQLEKIHGYFQSLHQNVDVFLKQVMEKQVPEAYIEYFLDLNIRQKLFKALEFEIHHFMLLYLSIHESSQTKDLMENLFESLDITLINLKEVMETEKNAITEEELVMQTLTADRGEVMENIRKAYLDKQSGYTISEKKDVLEGTLYFERSLWFAEQLSKQVLDTRHTYAEHMEIKQKWMSQLTGPKNII